MKGGSRTLRPDFESRTNLLEFPDAFGGDLSEIQVDLLGLRES
jgi:hypothetical protein